MDQLNLWHDTPEEALDADIQAIGGYKAAGYALWPARKMIEASRRLRRCLDPDRVEKLDHDEVSRLVELAASSGSRAYVTYLARRSSAKVIPVSPDDEKAELMEQWRQAKKQIDALAKAMQLADGSHKGL